VYIVAFQGGKADGLTSTMDLQSVAIEYRILNPTLTGIGLQIRFSGSNCKSTIALK
jgi:hypothetical protein